MSNSFPAIACILAAALTAGCTSAAKPTPSSAASITDCVQLDRALTRAAESKRIAQDKQDNAWKAIVPFAVVARHASGNSAVAESERPQGRELAAARVHRRIERVERAEDRAARHLQQTEEQERARHLQQHEHGARAFPKHPREHQGNELHLVVRIPLKTAGSLGERPPSWQ